ncbi:MAG: recombinase RecA [Chloroflexi bacterium]|nr:recombinase RecA [Chloroflexota bacterium]MBB37951.1 recombinase RecA [Actinomycetota bacterium]|tara:strand:- start:15535 stop:16593 length:1059 start_codon:yes stop_codon:yes gene_type:complete
MSTLDKLKKNSTVKETAILSNSKFLNNKDIVQTTVPALNVALSGKLDGGLTSGLTVFAGPSKHFKTAFAMLLSKSYLDKYDDGVVLFYDSEFGAPQGYFDSFGIDTDRVVHTPVTDIEQLKHDVMSQLQGIERGDRVIIVVDSVGNLASKKEVDDALDGKSVADMTRAKQMKSLFRMVTPHLTIKDIPAVVVNHTYKEIGLFPKDVVSGGTGVYYSADNIFIIGRQQEKEGKEVVGYNFIINVEKSRFVREKSRIPIEVTWEGGISKWSGLLDMALESGHVVKPSNGWYAKSSEDDAKKVRIKDTYNKEFWIPILSDKTFIKWIEDRYLMSADAIMQSEVTEEDIQDAYSEV